jgi:hypothetical protein
MSPKKAECSAFVQILLQKEITVDKFAVHATGVKVAMTRKRKAVKRAIISSTSRTNAPLLVVPQG